MKAVQIVTIKSFSPIFKDGEEARNIHIVNVEEHDFNIVTQKSLYNIGDKAIYINPDYNLSDISLFESFIRPDGNPNKSRLGSNNRVRAIKFNFTDTNGNIVYSNGILLPLKEVLNYLNLTEINDKINLDELLSITKYEEPEKSNRGQAKGNLPNGMYKTDQENIKKLTRKLESLLPCVLIGTLKIDGSSHTSYFKSENNYGICSREQEKYLTQKYYEGFKPYYDKELKKQVWKNNDLIVEDVNSYFIENNLEIKETIAEDDFVQLGYPILEKLIEYRKPLAVRSEIYGQTLKGSGNKSNPHAKLPKSIAVYGIDDYSSNICVPLSMKETLALCEELNLSTVPIIFCQEFKTIEELNEVCENYFKDNLVEGIVISTYETNQFSAKYLNNEYDSKK